MNSSWKVLIVLVNLAVASEDASTLVQTSRRPTSLVVILDGTLCDRGPAEIYGETSSFAAIYDWSIHKDQRTHYEPGVGTRLPSLDPVGWTIDGKGMRSHALNAYRYLSKNYQPGSPIYIFGYSRGALSARYLQGIIHRYGLLEQPDHFPWNKTKVNADDLDKMLSDPKVPKHKNVKIRFMGLVDAVLRTLWEDGHAKDMTSMHLTMTNTVTELAHAMAIDETYTPIEVKELWTPPGVKEEQVWFGGVHGSIGGIGNPFMKDSSMVLSWMMDKAEAAGMMLRPDWKSKLNLHFTAETAANSPKHELRFRDPWKCRQKVYGLEQTKIKLHQSIKDEMDSDKGWTYLMKCCPYDNSQEEEEHKLHGAPVEYVTNPTYEQGKGAKATPTWIRITPRQFELVPKLTKENVSYLLEFPCEMCFETHYTLMLHNESFAYPKQVYNFPETADTIIVQYAPQKNENMQKVRLHGEHDGYDKDGSRWRPFMGEGMFNTVPHHDGRYEIKLGDQGIFHADIEYVYHDNEVKADLKNGDKAPICTVFHNLAQYHGVKACMHPFGGNRTCNDIKTEVTTGLSWDKHTSDEAIEIERSSIRTLSKKKGARATADQVELTPAKYLGPLKQKS